MPFIVPLGRERLRDLFPKVADAFAVRGRNGIGSPRPSSWKSASTMPAFMPSALFTATNTGRSILRGLLAISLSCGSGRCAIDHEDHGIGFGNRLLGLAGHFMEDALLDQGFKAAGIQPPNGAFFRLP